MPTIYIQVAVAVVWCGAVAFAASTWAHLLCLHAVDELKERERIASCTRQRGASCPPAEPQNLLTGARAAP